MANSIIVLPNGIQSNGVSLDVDVQATPLPTYSLGDNVYGGKIVYIFQSEDAPYVEGEQRGIVINETQLTGQFGCYRDGGEDTWIFEQPNFNSNTLGQGLNNTLSAISKGVETCDPYYFTYWAPFICSGLSYGSYADWFLPNSTELAKMSIYYTTLQSGWFLASDTCGLDCIGTLIDGVPSVGDSWRSDIIFYPVRYFSNTVPPILPM